MTKLLQEAINKIQELSPEQQDAIALRLLDDLEDEQKWEYLFTNTTDEQWTKMAEKVKQDIINGDVMLLDDFLEEQNEI